MQPWTGRWSTLGHSSPAPALGADPALKQFPRPYHWQYPSAGAHGVLHNFCKRTGSASAGAGWVADVVSDKNEPPPLAAVPVNQVLHGLEVPPFLFEEIGAKKVCVGSSGVQCVESAPTACKMLGYFSLSRGPGCANWIGKCFEGSPGQKLGQSQPVLDDRTFESSWRRLPGMQMPKCVAT